MFQDPTDDHYNRDADSDGGFLDGGSEDENGDTNRFRQVFWETTVHLIGEPNPLLAIDRRAPSSPRRATSTSRPTTR